MNNVTIICQDKYEAQKLANLIFVNDTKETYVTEILNVVENEVVLSIKDKSAPVSYTHLTLPTICSV